MTTPKKFDPTKPCTTRDGRKVRILCTDLKPRDEECPDTIAAAAMHPDGYEHVFAVNANGRYSYTGESSLDLINVPTKREGWVRIYRCESGNVRTSRTIHNTKADAEQFAQKFEQINYLAIAPISWEE